LNIEVPKTKVFNRLEDQCCVMCGSELISPKDAELSMCTICLKSAMDAAKKQIKNRKNRTGSVKRTRMKVRPDLVYYKK